MGVRDMDRFLERWEMDVPGVRRRRILAPVPRERWYALWLLTQGWTAQAAAGALERDPHTIGRWVSAFGVGGALSPEEFCPDPGGPPMAEARYGLGIRIVERPQP